MYLLPALSLFQDHKFIRKTFHTDTTANPKAALFHPIPLYDKLWHIFTAVYRSRISFHSVDIPPTIQHFIDYDPVSPDTFHNLKHSGKYDVFSIITGFHKIIIFLYQFPLSDLLKQDMPVLMQKARQHPEVVESIERIRHGIKLSDRQAGIRIIAGKLFFSRHHQKTYFFHKFPLLHY